MIAEDTLPVCFVEGDGFRDLMAFVEPEYKVPCRQTMTTRMEAMYKKKADSLRRALSNAKSVAITTDAWTALTTESYVTITAHYFDGWVVKSAILQTRAMPERHTAKNMVHMAQTPDTCAGSRIGALHTHFSSPLMTDSKW